MQREDLRTGVVEREEACIVKNDTPKRALNLLDQSCRKRNQNTMNNDEKNGAQCIFKKNYQKTGINIFTSYVIHEA